ncbi:hypothetical protein ACTXT7_004267 [Hymenolepis weldensis]
MEDSGMKKTTKELERDEAGEVITINDVAINVDLCQWDAFSDRTGQFPYLIPVNMRGSRIRTSYQRDLMIFFHQPKSSSKNTSLNGHLGSLRSGYASMCIYRGHEVDAHWCLSTNFGSYNIYTKRASFKDDGVLQQFVTEMAGQPIIAPPVREEQNCMVEEVDELS